MPSLAEIDRLELHETPLFPKPTALPPEPIATPRRRTPVLGALLAVAVVGAVAAVVAWKALPRPAALDGTSAQVLIDSVPEGAEVFSGNERLGTTPLSFVNDYAADQRVELTVKAKGYKAAQVEFIGGRAQHVTARLTRGR